MKNLRFILYDIMLILLTVGVHKFIYRKMLWGYGNLAFYWGMFVLVYACLKSIIYKPIYQR
ncbi:bacteriocin-like WGxF protein [Fusibacter sp. JL216-2]|uniref:bacteriocin-like WGxF protein n=1 Tax=Fusibacter sp. JL216-2 TaxID=3071453 RepID=UPI003D328273